MVGGSIQACVSPLSLGLHSGGMGLLSTFDVGLKTIAFFLGDVTTCLCSLLQLPNHPVPVALSKQQRTTKDNKGLLT